MRARLGMNLGTLILPARLFGCQQSAVTAETVVRKEKVEEGKREKQKHRRIGRRERRRSKVQEEESGEGRSTFD